MTFNAAHFKSLVISVYELHSIAQLYQHHRINCLKKTEVPCSYLKRKSSKWTLFPCLSSIRMAQDAASFKYEPWRGKRAGVSLFVCVCQKEEYYRKEKGRETNVRAVVHEIKRYLANASGSDAYSGSSWKTLCLSVFVCREGRCEAVQPLRNIQIDEALQFPKNWTLLLPRAKSSGWGSWDMGYLLCHLFCFELHSIVGENLCWDYLPQSMSACFWFVLPEQTACSQSRNVTQPHTFPGCWPQNHSCLSVWLPVDVWGQDYIDF